MTQGILRFSQIAALTRLKRHTINARAKSLFKDDDLKRSASNQILLDPEQVRVIIQDRLSYDFKIGKFAYIGNLKGGVGKTTFADLLTSTASSLGIKTCAIDLDVQANLTKQYIDIDAKQPVMVDLIENKVNIQDLIIKISPTLDFIPSSLRNSLIQKSLSMQPPKHHLTWFNSIFIDYLRSEYELIIVDTPPHLTTLNSVFCLCLEKYDHIIIPACAEEFSIMGVQMFLDDICAIRASYAIACNPKISIIINRFLQQQKTNLEMLVKMGKEYGEMLSEMIVRDSAKIRETINNKISIGNIKQGKEVYEVIANLFEELGIFKSIEG
jgi:chromosome partitioning protein